MIRRYLFIYFIIFTIPLLLGLNVWQSFRYRELERDLGKLEREQEEWVESNKRLIAGIAVLSSSERIARIAVHDLGLIKIQPEDVLQIRIEARRRLDG
ncbi:MAG: cell division protein FtsL [Treponema sp.]|jgi:cell division protein FtsL|nr:cell division protein FtsL [Treponema sp.]